MSEQDRKRHQENIPVPLPYRWSQLGQDQGLIQTCSHTSSHRTSNDVYLPYQMRHRNKANILTSTRVWRGRYFTFYGAKEVELNLIHKTQKTFLIFNQLNPYHTKPSANKIYILVNLVLLEKKRLLLLVVKQSPWNFSCLNARMISKI